MASGQGSTDPSSAGGQRAPGLRSSQPSPPAGHGRRPPGRLTAPETGGRPPDADGVTATRAEHRRTSGVAEHSRATEHRLADHRAPGRGRPGWETALRPWRGGRIARTPQPPRTGRQPSRSEKPYPRRRSAGSADRGLVRPSPSRLTLQGLQLHRTANARLRLPTGCHSTGQRMSGSDFPITEAGWIAQRAPLVDQHRRLPDTIWVRPLADNECLPWPSHRPSGRSRRVQVRA